MIGCFGGAGPFRRSLSVPAPAGTRTQSDMPGSFRSASLCEGDPHPAAEALRTGRLAISFSGGGFLLPYFIGVVEVLQQLGVLRLPTTTTTCNKRNGIADDATHLPSSSAASATASASSTPSPPSPPAPTASYTPLAGSSAGSLIATSLACGLTPAQMLDSFLDSVRDCRTKGSYRRLNEVLLKQLEESLPPDAAERCNGVATVGITRVFPAPRTRRVSTFASRSDLIAALLASCHIPRYFNGDLTTTFRGKVSIDGGVTSLIPKPHAQYDFLLKVSCFPRRHIGRLPVFNRQRALQHLSLGISPDAFGPWPFTLQDMLQHALHPHTDDFIALLLKAGRSDAVRWAASAGLAPPELLAALGPVSPSELTADSLSDLLHFMPLPPPLDAAAAAVGSMTVPVDGVPEPPMPTDVVTAAATERAMVASEEVASTDAGPAVAAVTPQGYQQLSGTGVDGADITTGRGGGLEKGSSRGAAAAVAESAAAQPPAHVAALHAAALGHAHGQRPHHTGPRLPHETAALLFAAGGKALPDGKS